MNGLTARSGIGISSGGYARVPARRSLCSREGEFRRLLELDFDQQLSAHGTLLRSGAHEACERAVDEMFSD